MKDLEDAIGVARQAVKSTPLEHPDLGIYLHSLGRWVGIRFVEDGETKDLEEAVDVARRAVERTPHQHPNQAMQLNGLGCWLGKRFEQTGEMRDLEEAISCYQQAFNCTPAVPLERLKAGALCLKELAYSSKLPEAVRLGQDALALLPIVNNRNLDRRDQQFVLSGFAGIASDLCAVLLLEGRVREAIEYLEQGRAVIISRLLDDRSDVLELKRKHPELA
jgi:tetratricopeptide (TPR) repeat protein